MAPRATPKPSTLPESTLVGFPWDCGAHALSGEGRPDGAPHTREGRSGPFADAIAVRGECRTGVHELRKSRSAHERENHVLRSNREQIDSRRKHLIISTTVSFLSVDGTAADAHLLCSRLHRHVPTCLADGRAAHVIDASAALYIRRGLFASPPPFINTISTIEDVQARYGAHFDRAMRMPAEAVSDLSDILLPRLPRRGLSPFCRTALALRYLGGGSYVDICAVFGVHAATLYQRR